jgi:chromosome segregation ATPase
LVLNDPDKNVRIELATLRLEVEKYRVKEAENSKAIADLNTKLEASLNNEKSLAERLDEHTNNHSVRDAEVKELVAKNTILEEQLREANRRETENEQKYLCLQEEQEELLNEREAQLDTIGIDLRKANDIIRKLQSEIQKTHSKLDVLNKVTTKQDEVVTKKDDRLQQLEKDLKVCLDRMKKKESEHENLRSQLASLKNKFDESQQLIKTNEKVITWLNKQLAVRQADPSSPTLLQHNTNNKQTAGEASGPQAGRSKNSGPSFPGLPQVNLVDKQTTSRRNSDQQQHVYQRNPLFERTAGARATRHDPFTTTKVVK